MERNNVDSKNENSVDSSIVYNFFYWHKYNNKNETKFTTLVNET